MRFAIQVYVIIKSHLLVFPTTDSKTPAIITQKAICSLWFSVVAINASLPGVHIVSLMLPLTLSSLCLSHTSISESVKQLSLLCVCFVRAKRKTYSGCCGQRPPVYSLPLLTVVICGRVTCKPPALKDTFTPFTLITVQVWSYRWKSCVLSLSSYQR